MGILQIIGSRGCDAENLLLFSLRLTRGLAALPPLARTALGKPYFPSRPDLQLSLSHSGDLVLCAVGDRPVGVDVEIVIPRNARLPAYALTETEQAHYRALGGDWPAFYALWCKKEAWCKYTGQGLGRSFRSAPPEEGLFYGAYGGTEWKAALCGEEPPPEDILWLNPKTGEPCHGET